MNNSITLNGQTVPLTADATGWIAHHDGATIHVTSTRTAPVAVSPAKARWTAQ